MYNELDPSANLSLTNQNNKQDVRNYFICVYNNKHVGLFRKINWSTKIRHRYSYSRDEYEAGSIYVGVDSNYVGMKKTHESDIHFNYWQPVGEKIVLDGEEYVSNCFMQNGMSFDDMRLFMYKEGVIGPYEIGKADSKEILDVLKYASSYYQLEQNLKTQRTR